ncbi:putative cytochrome p450 protein [Diplocarpon rosae]|nr:putative cytochrome p450 protein [Diplocarpon rosae]
MVSKLGWIHIVQVVLIQAALGVAAYIQFILPKPTVPVSGRGATFVFGVGAKSLIFIAYQVLSKKYNKWYSPKANVIINCLEVVFWAAVVFMGIQANMNSCVGTRCIMSWVTVVLGGIISLVTAFSAYVCWGIFQAFKAQKLGMSGKDVEMAPTGYEPAPAASDDYPANKTYPTNNPFPPAASHQNTNSYPASTFQSNNTGYQNNPAYQNNNAGYQNQNRY